MPIRFRISSTVDAEVVSDVNVSNSPIPRLNTNDARGTVDPKLNPYDGSILDGMGVPQEMARSTIMGIAYGDQRGLTIPSNLPVRDLLSFVRMQNENSNVERTYRQRVRSPLTGIRGFCVVTCKAGSTKDVTRCKNMECALWALRLGKNAHHGKKK